MTVLYVIAPLLALAVLLRVRRSRKARSAVAVGARAQVAAHTWLDGSGRDRMPGSRWAGSRGFM